MQATFALLIMCAHGARSLCGPVMSAVKQIHPYVRRDIIHGQTRICYEHVTVITPLGLLPIIRKLDVFLFHGHFLRHDNFNPETSSEQSDGSAGVIGFEFDKSANFHHRNKSSGVCFTYFPFVLFVTVLFVCRRELV
jgi:hypothetical protein